MGPLPDDRTLTWNDAEHILIEWEEVARGDDGLVLYKVVAEMDSPMPPGGGGGPPGGTIEGTVLEDIGFGFAPEGVVPFAGATVAAFAGFEEVASTTSGADGSYSLSLPAGEYALTANFDDGETMCNGGTMLDVRVRNNKTSHRDILISCVSFP